MLDAQAPAVRVLVAVCLLVVTARRTHLEPATGPVATVLGNLLAYLAVVAGKGIASMLGGA